MYWLAESMQNIRSLCLVLSSCRFVLGSSYIHWLAGCMCVYKPVLLYNVYYNQSKIKRFAQLKLRLDGGWSMLLPFELKVFINTVQFLKKAKIIVLSWIFCILFWHSGAMLLVVIAVNLAFWRLWLHSCYVQKVFVFVNFHFFPSTTLNIKFVLRNSVRWTCELLKDIYILWYPS